jgi:hypothetical protein
MALSPSGNAAGIAGVVVLDPDWRFKQLNEA